MKVQFVYRFLGLESRGHNLTGVSGLQRRFLCDVGQLAWVKSSRWNNFQILCWPGRRQRVCHQWMRDILKAPWQLLEIVFFWLNVQLRNSWYHKNLDLLLWLQHVLLLQIPCRLSPFPFPPCVAHNDTKTFRVSSALERRGSHSLRHKVDSVKWEERVRPPSSGAAFFCSVGSDYITQVRRQVFNALSLPGGDVITVNVDGRCLCHPPTPLRSPSLDNSL